MLKGTIETPIVTWTEVRVEEEGSHASWEKDKNIHLQFNEYIYLTSTQTSMKNVLPIEINIIFEIYSPSADTREDTGLHTR